MASERIPLPTKEVWVSKDGRWTPIKEMATKHIENAINMMERQVSNAFYNLQSMALGLQKTADSLTPSWSTFVIDPAQRQFDVANIVFPLKHPSTRTLGEWVHSLAQLFLEEHCPAYKPLVAELAERKASEATNAPAKKAQSPLPTGSFFEFHDLELKSIGPNGVVFGTVRL
jgi:hypothetical protein